MFENERTFDENFINGLRDRVLLFFHKSLVGGRVIVIEDDDVRMQTPVSDGDKDHKRARATSCDDNERKRARATSGDDNERKRARDNSGEGGQRKRKRRKPRVYELRVHHEYLEHIRSGVKTFEGRPAREKYMTWWVGDVIRFSPTVLRGRRNRSSRGRRVAPCEMRIISTQRFRKGFRAMLEVVGVRACLPDLSDGDIDKGVRQYHSFGNFKKEAASVGAVAFGLAPV